MHNQGGGDRDWTPVQGRLPTHSHLSELEISLAEGGSSTKKEQSALTVVLQLVISGLASVILIVLGTINQFHGSVCSHSLEANSRNCGSLCHGYNLVIMY